MQLDTFAMHRDACICMSVYRQHTASHTNLLLCFATQALLHALDAASADEASQGAIVRCLSALSAGASPAASAAFK